MKNQHMKTEARSFRFLSLALVLLTLATLICCFTVTASAAGAQLEIGLEDLDMSGLQKDSATGQYYKVYDGNDTASVTLKSDADIGIAAGDEVEVIVTATFNSKLVKEATYITVSFELKGEDKDNYRTPDSFTVAATIRPKTIGWAGEGSTTTTVVPGKTTYEGLTVTVPNPALKAEDIVSGDTVTISGTAPTVTVNGVTAAGEYTASATVTLEGTSKDNYVVAPLPVKVTVEKIKITMIEWADDYTFTWGDNAAESIVVTGYDKDDKAYKLVVVYPDGYGTVGTHGIRVELPDATNMEWAQNNTANTEKQVVIVKKQFTVGMQDMAVIGNEGYQQTPDVFDMAVSGDIPADIRALIEYTANGEAFAATSKYGIYQVTATLPSSTNYEFVDANGNAVTTLSATLSINKQFVVAPNGDIPYQLILIGENGFAGDVTASVSIPEKIARKAISGKPIYVAYTLKVEGAAKDTFTVLIPISDTLYNKNGEALTADDLYIYEEATGTMVKASEKSGYKVTVADGHYYVEGVSGSAAVTFVIAPTYNTPFWLTAVGIALLILLILAFFAMLILIGLYLYRRIRENEENEVMIIDTEGDVPAVEPVVIEDTVDADAYLDETAEKIAEDLEPEVEAEAEESEPVDVEDAVAESMDELLEGEETVEAEEEDAEEVVETDPAEDMVDQKAEELADTPAEEEAEAEADEDAVRDAVDSAMDEGLNESADATDAVVAVVEEEEIDIFSVDDFKAIVDTIVSDAMVDTMVLPEHIFEESVEETEATETAEEAIETIEEPTETTEETAEIVAEEVTEDATETVTEDVAEETVTEETVTEDVAEEAVVEESDDMNVCAVVADSVAETFELLIAEGVEPKAKEDTTIETITEAVKTAGDKYIPETWTEELANAVIEAIIEELAARLLVEEEPAEEPVEEEPVEEPVEEEAVETFAAVEEEAEPVVEEKPESDEDDDDGDEGEEEEDDDSFAGFGSMPLEFIDAIAEADKYAEMLEQERNGEVRLVTRYRRSFQSRLIQSQGNVQDYYSALKNALLAHKGVKNRISWNYEAYNRGRTHVAKINAKTRTLYLYLALDPEELKGTKYGIVDVSSKKKYASVPVLMKIKGDRKFKYALELIDKLCQEKLGLPKMEIEPTDYRVPYQTTEELAEAGVVKKMVASVPVSAYGAESTEEAPTTPSSASAEAQEVSFIAPTDAPAVEAAAEEVAAEEAAAAEAVVEEPTEEVSAQAETSEDTQA